jgi:imidazolonepropionase-like amidohydrolase
MMFLRRLIPIFIAALGLCGFRAEAAPTIFTNCRLIDGNGGPPVEKASLVIDGGKIVAAGKIDPAPYEKEAGAVTVPCDGKTIMPALISDHSHLGIVKGDTISAANYTPENIKAALAQYEGYGVTAVLSLGMNKDLLYTLRDQQRAGKLGGADIFTADRGLGVADAAPPQQIGPDQVSRPSSPDEARRMVREMAARHPDLIKCWVDDLFGKVPKMPPEIYTAIIDESHKQGLRVAAHLFYLDDAKALVRDGLDVVAHSVRDQPVDAEFLDLMKTHRAAYIPTLTLDESQFIYAEHPAWMDEPAFLAAVDPSLRGKWLSPAYAYKMGKNPLTPLNKAALATGLKNVKAVHDAGILVGFGTDSGAMPTRIPGWAEHRELQLLVQAGLTPMDAIVCATRNAAIVLGDDKNRGTLDPGKRADFLILAGNPLEDIANTTKLDAVYHGGRAVKPLIPPHLALKP